MTAMTTSSTCPASDWGPVLRRVESLYAPDAERVARVIRETADFRAWCDQAGLDPARVGPGEIVGFLEAWRLARTSAGKPADVYKQKNRIKDLLEAARTVRPTRARSPKFATARLDEVPERSDLGKAIAAVLADAQTAGDRARWPSVIGRFLRWCDQRGIAAPDCHEADLFAYRRYLLTDGVRSTGEYTRVAKRLVMRLAETPKAGEGRVTDRASTSAAGRAVGDAPRRWPAPFGS